VATLSPKCPRRFNWREEAAQVIFWSVYPSLVILICMSDVTRILSQIESGDPSAADELLPLVYDELRKLAAAKLANETPGQTLQATALVHHAYVRLVEVEKAQHWNSRGHFFAAAAAIRRILINRARDRGRLKRGGTLRRVDLDAIEIALDTPDENLLLLDEALQQAAATALSASTNTSRRVASSRMSASVTSTAMDRKM
jgi:RNA polymerase sigma factor (TIGR02999 family)